MNDKAGIFLSDFKKFFFHIGEKCGQALELTAGHLSCHSVIIAGFLPDKFFEASVNDFIDRLSRVYSVFRINENAYTSEWKHLFYLIMAGIITPIAGYFSVSSQVIITGCLLSFIFIITLSS